MTIQEKSPFSRSGRPIKSGSLFRNLYMLSTVACDALLCSKCFSVEGESRRIGRKIAYSEITPYGFKCSKCSVKKEAAFEPLFQSPTADDSLRSNMKVTGSEKMDCLMSVLFNDHVGNSSQVPDGRSKEENVTRTTVATSRYNLRGKRNYPAAASAEIFFSLSHDEETESPSGKRQCSRINGKGWRCKRTAKNGFSLCLRHLQLARLANKEKKKAAFNNAQGRF